MKKTDLSIVIPAYCEEQRIGRTLDELAMYLKTDSILKKQSVEVLIVAADAPDKTHVIVQSKLALFKRGILLKPGPRVGKGRDVQYGMLRATGAHVLFMDADLATPLHHIAEFYHISVKEPENIVIGVRNLSTYRRNRLRNIFSTIGNSFYQMAGGLHIKDTQCGFKMFNVAASKLCFGRLSILGWGFDLEILAIAQANQLKIKTIELSDWQHKPFTTYHDNALKITARMIRDFIIISLRRLRGTYQR